MDEDGHSGFSWTMTVSILKRLTDGKPLTPIEDTEDVWKDPYKQRYSDHTVMQCLRMPSLFKFIYDNGKIEYYDSNQFIGIDIHSGIPYSLGLIRDVMQKKFPITFPYMPGNTIKVYCEDFLAEPGNGDFDTVGILYCQTDNGKEDIKRYFKGLSNNSGWKEINFDEYMKRKVMADKLKEKIMLNFKVHYDDGDYSGISKVYAIDTTRYRFLVRNSYDGRFLWVDIKDCILEEDDSISFEGFQKKIDNWYKDHEFELCDPPIDAQFALDLIFKTLIDDEKHYPYLTTIPESTEQTNAIMLNLILKNIASNIENFERRIKMNSTLKVIEHIFAYIGGGCVAILSYEILGLLKDDIIDSFKKLKSKCIEKRQLR